MCDLRNAAALIKSPKRISSLYMDIWHTGPQVHHGQKGQSTQKRLRQMKSSDLRSNWCKQGELHAGKEKTKWMGCTEV